MIQSKAIPASPAFRARSLARPPGAKWSPRKTLLFVLAASTLGWMTILVPLLSRL